MAVVAVALLGVEVVRANDGRARDHLASSGHAQVAGVVRYRAPKATHQPAYRERGDTKMDQEAVYTQVQNLLNSFRSEPHL